MINALLLSMRTCKIDQYRASQCPCLLRGPGNCCRLGIAEHGSQVLRRLRGVNLDKRERLDRRTSVPIVRLVSRAAHVLVQPAGIPGRRSDSYSLERTRRQSGKSGDNECTSYLTERCIILRRALAQDDARTVMIDI
jgi:hypothetical protein